MEEDTTFSSSGIKKFANYNSSVPPILLRSRQASKAEYVTSCANLADKLGQAMGLSHYIPEERQIYFCQLLILVYYNTDYSNFADVSKGKTIPVDHLIDFKNEISLTYSSLAPTLTRADLSTTFSAAKSTAEWQLPTSQKEPNSTGPANTTNQPLSHSPPPPMVNLQTATNTDSNALGTEPAGEHSVPSTLTPQRGPISSILNDSIWAELSLVHSEATHNFWLKEIQRYCKCEILLWFSPGLIKISNLKSINLAELKANRNFKLLKSHLKTLSQNVSCLIAQPFTAALVILVLFFKHSFLICYKHPLVLLLLDIQKPEKVYLSQWANCIASLIQFTSLEFSIIPPYLNNFYNDNLDSHLGILKFLISSIVSVTRTHNQHFHYLLNHKRFHKRRSWTNITCNITTHLFDFNLLQVFWYFGFGLLELSVYIGSLFIDSFLNPNCHFYFHKLKIIQISQEITADSLFHSKKFPKKQVSNPLCHHFQMSGLFFPPKTLSWFNCYPCFLSCPFPK
ncbi:uncharacterized protein VP01_49g1 [Puccinia sorghi]|uniref:Uncharacterized protein n=1 Tax=Puccinia sorghi TaxID=27349 RepID=A0A0L6ULQ8_9BASI|nr:uncharacterized protein VP01_49g1 [Puccinia sorghi]